MEWNFGAPPLIQIYAWWVSPVILQNKDGWWGGGVKQKVPPPHIVNEDSKNTYWLWIWIKNLHQLFNFLMHKMQSSWNKELLLRSYISIHQDQELKKIAQDLFGCYLMYD